MNFFNRPVSLVLAIFAFFLSLFFAQAQQFSKATGGSSSNQLMGSTTAIHTQLLYNAADLGLSAPGVIDRIYFRRGALGGNTLGSFQIKMKQQTASSFSSFNTVFETGLQTVFSSASVTIPTGAADAWFSFNINSFGYDPSLQLVVDISFISSTDVSFSTTSSSIGSTFTGRRKLFANNTTSPTGTSSSDWPDFGLDMAPTNDECGGALVLSPGINCVNRLNSTTFAASQSTPGVSCTGSLTMNADDDVWFMFQASGQGDTISVSAIDGAFDAVVDVYNNCQGGVRVACADATTTGGSETIRMPNLVAGEIYYVRVYSFDTFKGQFSICLRNRNNPCLTPTPTIKANRTETTSNGSILLTLTSSSAGLGLLWQQSTDQGNNWTDLQGHNAPIDTIIYQSIVTDTVYFRAYVQAGNCQSAYSNPVKVFVHCAVPIVFPPASGGDFISNVKLNEIDNTSTFDPLGGGYQNFKNLTANLCVGESSDLSLETPVGVANNRLVWIDFNQDGDYDDQGEKVFAGARNTLSSLSVPISVPFGTPTGKTTMRISIFNDFESQSGDGPCDNDQYFFGEIEEYSIQINQLVQADAGVTGLNCGSMAVLTANSITNGLGTWAVVTGSGTFADVNDPHTTVTNLANGINVLRWTASSALCNSNSDTVVLTVNQPFLANAGTDQVVCTTAVSLSGNAGPVGSTMKWNNISGLGFLSTFGQSAFYFPPSQSGTYQLEYTITIPGCPISRDTVSVTFRSNPSTAVAGTNQTVCGSIATLAATAPTIGTGKWTVVTGTGTFANDSDPRTQVTGLTVGSNSFRWTVSNNPCPSNSAVVSITSNAIVQANAGTDLEVCSPFVTVNGNAGPVGSTYTWTKLSGNGNLSSFVGPSAFFSGITAGISVLKFGLVVPGCPISEDTLQITNYYPESEVNTYAGIDQTVCGNSAVMTASTPSPGVGSWSVISGTGTFSNANDPHATASGLSAGANTFRWTVVNQPCPTDFDEVTITTITPVQANAGTDQVVCTTFVSLTGNTGPAGTNYGWAKISGVGTLIGTGGPSISYSGIGVGASLLEFSLTVPGCPASLDTVQVTRRANPTVSQAGSDQVVCGTTATLGGNTPAIGTGRWTVLSGSGVFANNADPFTQVTGLQSGANVFRWTITNNPCTPSGDNVTITSTQLVAANAGTDQVVCTTFVSLNGNSGPVGATYGWTKISGVGTLSGTSGPSAFYSGIGVGTSSLQFSLTVPGCPPSLDTVQVTRSADPEADAGPDQVICSTTATLAGNTPTEGIGTWKKISGAGAITSIHNPISQVTGLQAGTISTFRWVVANITCPSDSDDVSIGVNQPVTPNAGTDQTLCATSATLSGTPKPVAFPIILNGGTAVIIIRPSVLWTRATGSAIISDPDSNITNITGLTAGENRFRYSIFVPACGTQTDSVSVFRVQPPTTSNAGTDQAICGSTATLAGNTPARGTGKWTVVSGSGSFVNDASPTTQVTGLQTGTNSLRWTISNAPCASSSDVVTINVTLQFTVNAGPDVSVCSTAVVLNADTAGTNGGLWTLVSGSGTISPFNSGKQAVINGLAAGLNVFEYSTFTTCGLLKDTVVVTRIIAPVANAGTDQTLCATSATLNATNPANGTGRWSRVSGSGTIQNPTNRNSSVTGLGLGSNVFKWKVTNAPCPADSDLVSLVVNSIIAALAGPDQVVCTTFVGLTVTGNDPPVSGTPLWTRISGAGVVNSPNSKSTTITGLGVGVNTFEYRITVPGCGDTRDTVVITGVASPSTANSGPPQTVCVNRATMAANTPTVGEGTWTVLVGSGTFADIHDPNTEISGLAVGNNLLRWEIKNPPCFSSSQVTQVTYILPDTVDLGPDIEVCSTGVSITANVAGGQGGTWTLLGGSGTITTLNNGIQAVISGLAPGANVFEYQTLTQCGLIKDTIVVTRFIPPVANAGTNQNVCSTSATLNATNPASGTGRWSRVSGSGTVQNPTNRNSNVIGLGIGNNVFKWKVSNAPCPADSDLVTITRTAPIVANAGPDQFINTTTTSLAAGNLTGTWTLLSGAGTIAAPSNPSTTVSGLGIGANTFVWTVTNSPCPISTDQVTLTVSETDRCDSLEISISPATKNVVTDPLANAGWYYSVTATFTFPMGYFPTVGFTATEIGNGSLTVAPDATLAELNFTFTPGPKTVCFKAYYQTIQGTLDSCVQCQDFDFPFPPTCEFFDLKTQKQCGSMASAKVVYSNQSPVENFIVSFGDGEFYTSSTNGDSVVHDFESPGTYTICAKGYYNQGLDSCVVCKTVVISAGPDAGFDQLFCRDSTSLTGNLPPSGTLISWALISGSGTVDSPGTRVTTVSNLGTGTSEFVYTFSTPGCPDQSDTVQVTREAPPTPASVGPDQVVCTDSTLLISSSPYVGSALWTVQSGTGNLEDPTNNNTLVFGLAVGDNVFRYTVSNGICASSFDEVTVTYNPPPRVNAGPDVAVCSTAVILIADTVGIDGGDWTLLSGSGTISPFNSGKTAVINGLAPGVNVFEYSTSLGCSIQKDTIEVNRRIAPVANAGTDQSVCATSATLNATNPANGAGIWSRVSGSGTVQNPTNRNSTVTGLGIGNNVFNWKVTNAPCPADSDQVTITRTAPIVADAGPDQNLATNATTLAAGNPTGTWSLFSGTGSIAEPTNPTSSVSGLGLGANRFIWTVLNAPCTASTDTVAINVNPVTNPCSEVSLIAQADTLLQGTVNLTFPFTSIIHSYIVRFGDNSQTDLMDDTATSVTHTFPGPGMYNVCGTFYFTNALQAPDSCQVCDTIRIPVPFNPCDSLTVNTITTQNVMPAGFPLGWIYDLATTIDFVDGSITQTKFNINGDQLKDVNTYGPGDNRSFTYVVDPGTTTLCVYGYFNNFAGQKDSCTVCKTFDFPFPPACEFFDLKTEKQCGTKASTKVVYSNQSPIENFIISFGDGKFYSGNANGDSVVHDFDEPGQYIVCAKGYYNQGLDSCEVCDTITIPAGPNAGVDQIICSDSVTLAGNGPPTGYLSSWTRISGSGTVDSPNTASTTISGLGTGTSEFVYTFFSQTCPSQTDTVRVTRQALPVALAGLDQVICANFTLLEASPALVGSGQWTLVSGSGTILNPASPNTTVNNLANGENVFVWTVTNSPCPSGSDSVTVSVSQPLTVSAGFDQLSCNAGAALNGSILSGTPNANALIQWTLLSGSGLITNSSSLTASVSNLGIGENSFVLTITQPGCGAVSDTVIKMREPQTEQADAGQDQIGCSSTVSLLGNLPNEHSGLWTLTSGSGTIQTPGSSATEVSGLGAGTNRFVWTISTLCGTTTDTVDIVYQPLAANAGTDRSVCRDSVRLEGNGSGVWTLVSGSGNIVSPTSSDSDVLQLGIGANTFQWKVEGQGCPADSDQVIITYTPPILANAGADDTVYVDSTTLIANNFGGGSAVWTKILGGAIIESPNSPVTDVMSLSPGLNKFVWTVTNPTCEDEKVNSEVVTSDTVTITFLVPVGANAGSDFTVCEDTLILAGNSAGQGTGQWTVIHGGATVDEPQNPLSVVHNLSPGDNIFEWMVTVPSLEPTKDTVVVHRYLPAVADAGPDQNLCNLQTVTLTAAPDPENRNGSWFLLSGCGIIANATSRTTTVTDVCDGENVFEWKTFDPLCNTSNGGPTDEVRIFITLPDEALAGNDQETCADFTQMEASVPPNGTGQWSTLTGNGNFTNPSAGNTSVNNLAVGINTFVWTVTTGNCPPEIDTVLIIRVAPLPTANVGNDQTVCGNTATLEGNSPLSGSGVWTQITGSGQISVPEDSVTTVSNLPLGDNQFVWTIFNGICPQTSDTVTLTVNPVPVAAAGFDASVCTDTSHLAATPVSGNASGSWSVISGSASVASPGQAFTSISNLSVGQNQFVWTVSVVGCSPVSDTMVVFRTGATASTFAGNDTAICGTITNLNADAPLAGTGIWTVVTGTGQLLDANDPKTSVSGLQAGTNVLVWSVGNSPCPVSSDTVVITVNQSFAANAGPSYFACSDTGSLHAVPPEGTSTGAWTVETGTAIVTNPTSANTLVTNISSGLNVFRWTVSVATCPDVSDTVAVIKLDNTLDLGHDTLICVGDSLELTVPPGFTGFTWSTGSTLPTIKLLASDTVILTVNTQQNCNFSDTIRVQFGICDAVQPQLVNVGLNVSLQPNPASSLLNLHIHSIEDKLLGLTVFDALGKPVLLETSFRSFRTSTQSVDVNKLPNGVYSIRLMGDKVHWVQKFVVTH